MPTPLPLYWVDAFADRLFAGNPAAVVPLPEWPPDELLRRIAFENGLSETAFFVRTGPGRFHLRWFTPAIEIDLCGHATLASAHVLHQELGEPGDLLTFDSRSGPLTVARRADGKLELDFPARPSSPVSASATLAQALSRTPSHVAQSVNSWLCVYPRAEDVLELRPDHAALARLKPGRFIVTAPGMDCDFVSRFFAPDAGIAEDPVTGSAHCVLVPYWAERLGKTALHARQVSARGGELWCELRPGTTPAEGRVRIAGHSRLYLKGEIQTG